MKKVLSTVLIALFLCSALASCSSESEESKNTSEPGSVTDVSDTLSPEESSLAPASQIVTDEDSGESYDLSEYSPVGTEGATKIIVRYSDVGKVMNLKFENNTDITDVYIEDGIEYFDFFDFSGCTSLKNVRLPRTLKSFDASEQKKGGGTFSGCISLESIYIPDGVDGINDDVFLGCTSLKNIRLPEGLTYIGSYAFTGCDALEEIDFPSTLRRIGKGALPNNMKVWDLPDNVDYIWFITANTVCVKEGSVTHETIKHHIDLGEFAGEIIFKGSDEESSSAPASQIVTDEDSGESYDLSEYSPIGTEGATKIIIRYSDVGDTLDDRFMGNETITDVYIEDGITTIAPYAFYECKSLKSVRLPRTLTDLGEGPPGKGGGFVFYGCALESIYIPQGIKGMPEQNFSGNHLKDLVIPEGVEWLGAFCGANANTKLPSTLKYIGKDALPYGLEELDLPDNIEYIWYLDAKTVYVREGSTTHETLLLGVDGGRMWAADYGGNIVFKD